uniref:polysaccharide deacetylase n=1 Tax=Fluviicola sp. TaxID=1917219 RepID=UPI00261909A6
MNITMHKYGVFWMAFLLSLSFSFSFSQTTIENYHFFLATGNLKGQELLVLRHFDQQGNHFYFTVNMQTLETAVLPAKDLAVTETSWSKLIASFSDRPYIKALVYADKQSFAMQDAGITHGYPVEKGITLTIDLCPSEKPLDRTIFTSLIAEFSKIEQPVPLALSLSGRFLLTHINDIEWLKGLQAKGNIAITWINHSYTHYYNPKLPLAENFLLKPNTDLNLEVLGTEIAMLQ